MGLISSLMGNASEADAAEMQADLEAVLAPGEQVDKAFKIFRDALVFTDHRLILIDKQGLTGSKAMYHSILFRSVTQFSVETAGTFDADAELRIWVSSAAEPIAKQFKRGTDIVGIQQHLAHCVFGGSRK